MVEDLIFSQIFALHEPGGNSGASATIVFGLDTDGHVWYRNVWDELWTPMSMKPKVEEEDDAD